MSDDDAAKIINDAACKATTFEAQDIRVKGLETRLRDPHRILRMGVLDVLPCEQYPAGAELYVPVRQIGQHLKLYPGSRVLRVIEKQMVRPLRSSGVRPLGHDPEQTFLKGRKVVTPDDGS